MRDEFSVKKKKWSKLVKTHFFKYVQNKMLKDTKITLIKLNFQLQTYWNHFKTSYNCF